MNPSRLRAGVAVLESEGVPDELVMRILAVDRHVVHEFEVLHVRRIRAEHPRIAVERHRIIRARDLELFLRVWECRQVEERLLPVEHPDNAEMLLAGEVEQAGLPGRRIPDSGFYTGAAAVVFPMVKSAADV